MENKKEESAEEADVKENTEPEILKKRLEESEKQCSEYLAGWQRARAEFLNYKREENEMVENIIKYANEEFPNNLDGRFLGGTFSLTTLLAWLKR